MGSARYSSFGCRNRIQCRNLMIFQTGSLHLPFAPFHSSCDKRNATMSTSLSRRTPDLPRVGATGDRQPSISVRRYCFQKTRSCRQRSVFYCLSRRFHHLCGARQCGDRNVPFRPNAYVSKPLIIQTQRGKTGHPRTPLGQLCFKTTHFAETMIAACDYGI